MQQKQGGDQNEAEENRNARHRLDEAAAELDDIARDGIGKLAGGAATLAPNPKSPLRGVAGHSVRSRSSVSNVSR